VFIRYIKNNNDIDEEQIHNFYKNISKINMGLLFKFILISDCDELQLSNNLINKINLYYINLNKYIDDDVLHLWTFKSPDFRQFISNKVTLPRTFSMSKDVNEDNLYFRIIKKYKCIYRIIDNIPASYDLVLRTYLLKIKIKPIFFNIVFVKVINQRLYFFIIKVFVRFW